eukprot:11265326-Prorocentrum_lima.AAC.1
MQRVINATKNQAFPEVKTKATSIEAEVPMRALAYENEVKQRMDLGMQARRLSAEARVASLKQEIFGATK